MRKKEKEKEKMNMETRKTSFEEKLKENLGAEYKVTFPQRMEKQDEEFLRVGVQKSGESAGIWIYLVWHFQRPSVLRKNRMKWKRKLKAGTGSWKENRKFSD